MVLKIGNDFIFRQSVESESNAQSIWVDVVQRYRNLLTGIVICSHSSEKILVIQLSVRFSPIGDATDENFCSFECVHDFGSGHVDLRRIGLHRVC